MNTFKSLVLVIVALSALILSVSLNTVGHAVAQEDTQSSSPVALFKVGTKYRATLQSGSIQCKVLEIKGSWLKCEIPASGIPSDTATIWLNSYNILTVDTP